MTFFSMHACRRWGERFPGLDMQETYNRANVRTGKKMKKQIADSCKKHREQWIGTFKGKYIRMTQEKIVFIVAPPETVVTVLDFRES